MSEEVLNEILVRVNTHIKLTEAHNGTITDQIKAIKDRLNALEMALLNRKDLERHIQELEQRFTDGLAAIKHKGHRD